MYAGGGRVFAFSRMRGLFRGTGVAGRGIFRGTRARYYAQIPGHKLFYDAPTARQFIHGQGSRYTVMIICWPLWVFLLVLPWRYELGDWMDYMQHSLADVHAICGYSYYINEITGQRNRAYEFFRQFGRPTDTMKGIEQRMVNQPTTQAGWQAWDQETGRPIHSEENKARIMLFRGNPLLEKRYIEETKSDMDRIREIRARLTQIRNDMTGIRGDMYKKTME